MKTVEDAWNDLRKQCFPLHGPEALAQLKMTFFSGWAASLMIPRDAVKSEGITEKDYAQWEHDRMAEINLYIVSLHEKQQTN